MTEWSASQGDEFMTSSQEEACLIGARRAEQQGGNPLFGVDVERVGPPRSWPLLSFLYPFRFSRYSP